MTDDEGRTIEREALERIRLYGSPWWRDEWGTPSAIANDALNRADAEPPPLFKVILDELTKRGWTLVNTVGSEDRKPAIAPLYEDPEGTRYATLEDAIAAQTFREIAAS